MIGIRRGSEQEDDSKEFSFDYGVVSVRGRLPRPDELAVRLPAAMRTELRCWDGTMAAHSLAVGCLPMAMRALSTPTLLRMVGALLLEKQVVVVSASLERLSAVVHAASLLLRPLRWECPLLPVLPHKLLSFLDAPVPFLLGIPRPAAAHGGDIAKPMTALLSHIHGGGRPQLLMVDCDKDEVTHAAATLAEEGSPVPDKPAAPGPPGAGASMPLPGQRRLEDTLMPYGNCLRAEGPLEASEVEWAVRGVLNACEDYVSTALIGNLRAFTIKNVTAGKGGEKSAAVFMAREYLEGVPAADRPFVELFLQTQMVSALLGS